MGNRARPVILKLWILHALSTYMYYRSTCLFPNRGDCRRFGLSLISHLRPNRTREFILESDWAAISSGNSRPETPAGTTVRRPKYSKTTPIINMKCLRPSYPPPTALSRVLFRHRLPGVQWMLDLFFIRNDFESVTARPDARYPTQFSGPPAK